MCPIPGIIASQISGHLLSPSSGYFAGGFNSFSSIERLNFALETMSVLSATLPSGVSQGGGASNNGVAGYVAGGSGNTSYSASVKLIQKLLYTPQTTSTLSAELASPVAGTAAANSSTAMYVAAGYDGINIAHLSRIDKLLFSTEARSTLSATLASNRYGHPASAGPLAMYIPGGNTGGYTNSIEKLLFSTEARTTLAATLSNYVSSNTAFSSSTAMYSAGGYVPPNEINTIDKITFSTDTKSTIAATLSAPLSGMLSVSSTTSGYIAGGNNLTKIDKLLFSTETRTTLAAVLNGANGKGYGQTMANTAGA